MHCVLVIWVTSFREYMARKRIASLFAGRRQTYFFQVRCKMIVVNWEASKYTKLLSLCTDLIRLVYTSRTAVKVTLEILYNHHPSSDGDLAYVNYYAFECDLYFQYRSIVHCIAPLH